jgi:hypothetical protein
MNAPELGRFVRYVSPETVDEARELVASLVGPLREAEGELDANRRRVRGIEMFVEGICTMYPAARPPGVGFAHERLLLR